MARSIRVAKEICSFMEESGIVASQLKPCNPGASLVTSIVTERTQNAQHGEDTSVLPHSHLPLSRCLAFWTSGPWAPVWALPQGRGQPVGGQLLAARPRSPAHTGVAAGAQAAQSMPRRHGWRLRVGGSKEPPFWSFYERHLQGAPGPCAKEAGRAQGGLGRWGPDGFSPGSRLLTHEGSSGPRWPWKQTQGVWRTRPGSAEPAGTCA